MSIVFIVIYCLIAAVLIFGLTFQTKSFETKSGANRSVRPR